MTRARNPAKWLQSPTSTTKLTQCASLRLAQVRNCHGAFHYGFVPGLVYSGIAAHVLRGKEPWTFSNTSEDSDKTGEVANFEPIEYPKPDGVFSFDLLTNLQRSGTNHNDDQPAHLRIKADKGEAAWKDSIETYGGPEQNFCPAGVYEYVQEVRERSERAK